MSVLVLASAPAVSVLAPNATAGSGQKANKAVQALFGASLVRAEIVTDMGGAVGDYRINRGVVRQARARFLVLRERDGTVVRVAISSKTRITIDGRRVKANRVKRGMRATTLQNGRAKATWVNIARKQADKSINKIKPLLAQLIRTEVVSLAGGSLRDSRADIGIIDSVDGSSLTLSEFDGTLVQMQLDGTTQVQVNNKVGDVSWLGVDMQATTIRYGDGPVSQIWATGKKPSQAQGGGEK